VLECRGKPGEMISPHEPPDSIMYTLSSFERGRLNTTLRFPGSDVFVVQPEDPDSIVTLHERIATCGIEFDPSQFPFVPHCTLTQPANPTSTDPDASELQLDAEFTAATLSVYQIETFPLLTLRYRGYLRDIG
jgi:2'-5' RNA ligase